MCIATRKIDLINYIKNHEFHDQEELDEDELDDELWGEESIVSLTFFGIVALAFGISVWARGTGGELQPLQDPPVFYELNVTLEDIFNGATMEVTVTRQILNADSRTTRLEDKNLTINIKPGCPAGMEITFPKEGDQGPHSSPADIVYVVKDEPHAHFKRDGPDLHYTAKVSLKDALCGTTVQVPTLDGHSIPIRMTNEIINPTTVKRLRGQGLPISEQPSRRGDIVVKFDIIFPDQVTPTVKFIC